MADNANKTVNESGLPENQVETRTQDEPSFFQKRWRDIAMLIILICLWLFTGISIWFSILFFGFFWATETIAGKPANRVFLARVMQVIFVLALLNVVVIDLFPRLNLTRPTTLAFVDQTLSGLTPKDVKVQAKDIFTVEQRRASESFLRYYEFLLTEGRTKEAADTLAGFEKHWQFKLDTEKSDKKIGLQSGNALQQPQPQLQAQPQTPAPIPMAQKDSVFRTGEYEIQLVNGVTPFNIIIWFNGGSGKYTLESQNFEIFVQFPGETPIKALPGADFGHRIGARFRLFGADERVKLVVTKI